MLTLLISILTIILLILAIIIKPSVKIKNIELQTFWIIPLVAILLLFVFKEINLLYVKSTLFSNSSINPIKILVLFLSISFLSVTLDESGFFKKCALVATKMNGGNQKNLLFSLSIVISCLTIFTSNDIIILTFTPFICYFCKHAKISPIPYLISEFVFANTWSMMLIIGNPTNIYLAESFHINFFEYFSTMAIPTIITSISAFLIIFIIFKKKLTEKMCVNNEEITIKQDNFMMVISLFHLGLCTILLAISSYIKLEMWLISLCFAISLFIITTFYSLFKKNRILLHSLKRVPYNLIPFIISMFIIVSSLTNKGITQGISSFFNKFSISSSTTIFSYGISSFITCNILNNIPMSVLFEQIISSSNKLFLDEQVYSTIIASNIGAYLSPIGALAGIMWMSLLNKTGVRFSFLDFLKIGIIIAPLLLVIALSILTIMI